jgi:electron transfer flavoprotein beta subunit
VVEAVAAESLTEIITFELPPAKKGVKMIPADNAEELIRLLHDEAKVI